MARTNYTAYVFGGMFLCNAIPHYVSGVTGRAFQSPFAEPPGKGLSSAMINVLWGSGNLIAAYALLYMAGSFDLRKTGDAVAFGSGFFSMGIIAALLFGPLYGGDVN